MLLLGAYFTWRQVQTSREQLQHGAAATRDQLQLTREGQLTERFTRAVDQLGAEHLDVRLAGLGPIVRRELGRLPGVVVRGSGFDGRSDVVMF